MKTVSLSTIALSLLILASPATAAAPLAAAAPKSRPVAGRPLPSSLAGTAWRLVEFRSMDDAAGTVRPKDPARYTMRLDADGTLAMRLNCNHASGTWSAAPAGDGTTGTFALNLQAASYVLCPPPSMDAGIAGQAAFIRSYLLKDGRLYLVLMADGGIFAWEPLPGDPAAAGVPASPDDGGPRNWVATAASGRVNLREQPSATARIVARYSPGTVLDNLGCRNVGGRAWCDVQQLGGGPRGYVAAEFLKPAVSPDGSAAIGPDDSALRAGQGQFNATGSIPCAQNAGQPLGPCEFGVARAGGGYATVVVKKPEGRTRAIYFRMGRPIGADTSQADGAPEFRATQDSDLHQITIGTERYEIPAAVVLGG